MEEKKPISHIVAGLLIAAVLIVYSCILYFADIEQTGIFSFLPFVIILAGLIMFINMYGNAKNNQVTFGNLFAYGFKTTALLTLVVILFTVLFFLIFPDIKEKIFETTQQKMEEQGKMTPSEIEEGMKMWRNMFWVFTIGGILLLYAIVGAIGSLIGAAITKKRPVNPMDQLDMR
jgi:hypothetical protein